jgi:hypothetical protein
MISTTRSRSIRNVLPSYRRRQWKYRHVMELYDRPSKHWKGGMMDKPAKYVPDVKLYKATGKDGLWPSDIAAYYDRLDAERGFKKAKLIMGYKERKKVTSEDHHS